MTALHLKWLSEAELQHKKNQSRAFARRGEILAERLSSPITWSSVYGMEMHANAGDWLVTDGHKLWSVIDECFNASYTPVGDGFYRRTGVVLAVELDEDVRVLTLEGEAVARRGDWLCWYPYGYPCWPVSRDSFLSLYSAAA